MAQSSFALMTNLGRAKEAAALANGEPIVITHIAIGDGMTVPSGGETSLYHEVARKTISGHGTVVGASNVAFFDCYLAAEEGPFTIREAGLYDDDGDLIAIARYDPPINKPVPASGQTVEGTIRLEVAFSNVANVQIVIDPSMQVALQRLTRLPWIPIISMATAAPPASPAIGATYLVPTGATGSWSGHAGKIAEYTVAGWALLTPPNGHGISLPDGRIFERIDGAYIEKIARDVQSGKWSYAVATGTANALVVALTPTITQYLPGMTLKVKTIAKNTGPASLNAGAGAVQILRPSGTPLINGDMAAGGVYTFVYDGSAWVAAQLEPPIPLLEDVTLYVRNDGSDLNDGKQNTPASAFQTIQYAFDHAASRFVGARRITIQLAPGTYAPAELRGTPGLDILLRGNPANANVNDTVIQAAGTADALVASNYARLRVDGVFLQGGRNLLSARTFSQVEIGSIRLGDCSTYQLLASFTASIGGADQILVRGSAQSFLVSSYSRVALSGNISFGAGISYSVATVWANGGSININAVSFTGSIPTARRYLANATGSVFTGGGGQNFIPGTTAGTIDSGGVYL